MLSTIRSQLIALAVLTLLAVAIVGGAGIYVQGQMNQALQEAEGAGVAMRNHMQSDMLHDNLRGLVEQYTGAARDKDNERLQDSIKELNTNAKGIQEEFGKNKSIETLPASVRSEIARVEPIVKTYADAAVAVAKGSATDAGALEKARADFTNKFKVLEKELGDIRDKVEAAVVDAKKRGAESSDRGALAIAFAGLIAAVLVGLVSYLIYRNVTRGLVTIGGTIEQVNKGTLSARTGMLATNELGELGRSFDNLLDERVAALGKSSEENETLNNSVIALLQTVFQLGNRDLTARAPVTEDLIGTVASSINQFTDETARTMGEVQGIADQVRATSLSLNGQARLVQQASDRERVSLAEMTTNLNASTEQLVQVATLSDNSSRAAEKTAEATQNALAAVQETVLGMDGLRESISEMEKRFKRLGERSQEISSAVSLINTISERTHVLALNASMQAATAGEAGRGFAVVAEEVQRLSDSSRQATGQISQLVGNIQADTNETVFTVNRLITEVVKQSESAQRAGVQMTTTQAATQQLVGLVKQIAAFSQTQSDLARSLQQSVLDINAGADQTASAVASQTESTAALSQVAERLTESVGQFKLVAA